MLDGGDKGSGCACKYPRMSRNGRGTVGYGGAHSDAGGTGEAGCITGPDQGGKQIGIERALAWSVEVIEELGRQVKNDTPVENDTRRSKEEEEEDADVDARKS